MQALAALILILIAAGLLWLLLRGRPYLAGRGPLNRQIGRESWQGSWTDGYVQNDAALDTSPRERLRSPDSGEDE